MKIAVVTTANGAQQACLNGTAGVVIFAGSTWCRVFIRKDLSDLTEKADTWWRNDGEREGYVSFFAQRTTYDEASRMLRGGSGESLDDIGVLPKQ